MQTLSQLLRQLASQDEITVASTHRGSCSVAAARLSYSTLSLNFNNSTYRSRCERICLLDLFADKILNRRQRFVTVYQIFFFFFFLFPVIVG